MKKLLLCSFLWLNSMRAGCIVRDIINYTTTCTAQLLDCMVPPKARASDAPFVKECNETVGEFVIIVVREQDDDALICKQYKIMVDEYEKGKGNIRLVRSNSCDKNANFDVFVEEFKDMPLARCIINVQVYDSDRVHLQIIDESEKITPKTADKTVSKETA